MRGSPGVLTALILLSFSSMTADAQAPGDGVESLVGCVVGDVDDSCPEIVVGCDESRNCEPVKCEFSQRVGVGEGDVCETGVYACEDASVFGVLVCATSQGQVNCDAAGEACEFIVCIEDSDAGLTCLGALGLVDEEPTCGSEMHRDPESGRCVSNDSGRTPDFTCEPDCVNRDCDEDAIGTIACAEVWVGMAQIPWSSCDGGTEANYGMDCFVFSHGGGGGARDSVGAVTTDPQGHGVGMECDYGPQDSGVGSDLLAILNNGPAHYYACSGDAPDHKAWHDPANGADYHEATSTMNIAYNFGASVGATGKSTSAKAHYEWT